VPLIGAKASLTSLAVELTTLISVQTSVFDMTCMLLRKLASGYVTASIQTHVSSTVRPVSAVEINKKPSCRYRIADVRTASRSRESSN